LFFFSSRRRHTRWPRDWSSDVCSSDLYYRIWNYPKPVIAAVQGPALAGGCGLVSVCDYVLAAPEATFGYTEVTIGFLPAIVSVRSEERRVGKECRCRGGVVYEREENWN